MYICLDQCSKVCLPGRKAMATPNTWLLYLLFFPRHQGPGHCVNVSVNLKNVPIHYIGLSFAKVLLKPWRRTAFIWRLGGLNCGLAKASLQEYCSLGVEVSELAGEGKQGPKYYAKTSNLNVQHCAATTEKLRWLICPRSCSILAWCTGKVKHGYGESLAKGKNFIRRRCPFPRERIWSNPHVNWWIWGIKTHWNWLYKHINSHNLLYIHV